MDRDNLNTGEEVPFILPHVGSCYGHGWQRMWKYILELLLIMVILFSISIPSWGLSIAEEMGREDGFFLGIFSFAYSILILSPVQYGVAFASLKATRGEELEIKDMFHVFQNYTNAVLSALLAGAIIVIGFALLIIPGIIFACKLAFVPYLVVDQKMEAIPAVKASWRMTTGHAFTIFLMGLLAILISLAGIICFGVGIIVSIIWIQLAFAALYHAVTRPGVRNEFTHEQY
jgi:uncharacterized membrane protein